MTWDEFKEEWQKLEKSRMTEVIRIIIGLLMSAGIMICGITMWGEYSKELLDNSLKCALIGVMFFGIGQLLFSYICYIMLRDRVRRLEDGRE